MVSSSVRRTLTSTFLTRSSPRTAFAAFRSGRFGTRRPDRSRIATAIGHNCLRIGALRLVWRQLRQPRILHAPVQHGREYPHEGGFDTLNIAKCQVAIV